MIFLGDVMLGRLVNEHLKTAPPSYPWGDTLPLLTAADAVFANLECVIADRGAPWPGKIFTFRSDAKNVAVLDVAGVTAVSLANNHSLDYGPEALVECLATLGLHGIERAGAGPALEIAGRPAAFSVREVRVAFLAFTDNETAWEAGETTPGIFYVPMGEPDPRLDHLVWLIETAHRANDVVIVSAHWGPNWGDTPRPEHVTAAHLFVDAGADVVFGHSPHVMRGIEIYRGRPILYSCGDFIDDYAVDKVERNDESGVFAIDYERDRMQRVLLAPTVITGFQARLARGTERARIVARMQKLCAGLGTPAQEIPDGLRIVPV
jgi:poly-gamma-glutamate capsule biosynthesis protein CapA/YwtB (metallophosphatase superfamily)